MSIYKQLANLFIEEIINGKRKEGSRMPSLRTLARQEAISMSTVVSCYQELESQGWIHSRPQAGYFISPSSRAHATPDLVQFVSQVSTVKPSPILYATKNGPLGESNTPNDEQTVLELERSFRRTLKRLGSKVDQYPDKQGEPIFRQALSSHFSKLGLHFDSSELVITAGCMSAVKVALESCTREGDIIAISSPCFNGIIELLGSMSRKIVEIPCLEEGIDLEQFEAHLKENSIDAAVFCTSHMNPQGITMSSQQKQKLARLANHYQVPIIEDDVYLELSYSSQIPLPAKYYDKGGYILWCGSVSKSLSPSYRLGWCLPGKFQKTYQNIIAVTGFGVTMLTQLAIADFISSGQYNKHLRRRRAQLLVLRQQYLSYLITHLSPDVKISNPQGGMVLWLQIPSLNRQAFTKEISECNLDIRAGTLFSTRALYDECVRINIGHPLAGHAKEELDKMIAIVGRCS
ncbi:aminotransferase-like domain-containing protein [Vibrio sp. WJH972]